MGGVPRGIGLRANTKGNRLLHLSDGEFSDAADVANLQIENGGLYMSPKDMNSKFEPNAQQLICSIILIFYSRNSLAARDPPWSKAVSSGQGKPLPVHESR